MKKKREFKKKLEDFIKDESGNISRDTILKIGLGTVSSLGMLAAFSSDAAATHTSHASGNVQADHCSHVNHASHSSY